MVQQKKVSQYRSTFSLIFGFLLASCASHQVHSLEYSAPTSNPSSRWIASSNTFSFSKCEDAKKYALQKDFVLHDIATIRAYILCDNLSDLPTLPDENPWYADIVIQAKIHIAQIQNNPREQVQLLQKRAGTQKYRGDKLRSLQNALDVAKANHLETGSIQNQIYAISPSLNPNPPKSDYLKIAAEYRNDRDYDKSISFYNKVIHDSARTATEKYDALKGLRQTYKVSAQPDEFKKTALNTFKFAQKSMAANFAIEAGVYYAKAIWTDHDAEGAQAFLTQLVQNYKDKTSLADVYFVLARIQDESRNYSAEQTYLNSALGEKANADLNEKILWQSAWLKYSLKQYSAAAQDFLALVTQYQNTIDRFRFQFWYARSLRASKQDSAADEQYHNLETSDPYGYYGLLSYNDMNEKIPAIGEQSSQIANPKISEQEFKYLEALLSSDENDITESYISNLYQSYSKQGTLDENTQYYLFSSYARNGSYATLFSIVGGYTGARRTKLMATHADFLFPEPWFDIANTSAQKFKISHELVFSIMRQESTFNPNARSGMDAWGLLQLLPSVANNYSDETGIKIKTPGELLEPNKNIPIGTCLLSHLLRKHNQDFILTVASYNASEKSVMSWLDTRYRGDAVEFIEMVPFDETRNYIKLTMRNFIMYNRVEDPTHEMSFPTRLLQITSK